MSFGPNGYVWKCPGDIVWKWRSEPDEIVREADFMRAAGDCCVPLLSQVIRFDEQTKRFQTWGHVTELGKPFDCKAIPLENRAMVKSQLIDLLTCLHARGIIHGDVKPENLIWCRDGTLRFCDFGESRWIFRKRRKCLDELARVDDKEHYDGGNIHSTATSDSKKRPGDGNFQGADIRDTKIRKKGKTIKADTEAANTGMTDNNDAGTKMSIRGAENKKRPRTRAVAKAEAEAAKAKSAEVKEADDKHTHVHGAHDGPERAQGSEAQDGGDGSADDADYETGREWGMTVKYTSPNHGCEESKPPTKVDDWYALALVLWQIYTRESLFPGMVTERTEAPMVELIEAGGTVDIMAVKDESTREYIKKLLLAGGARTFGTAQFPRSPSS